MKNSNLPYLLIFLSIFCIICCDHSNISKSKEDPYQDIDRSDTILWIHYAAECGDIKQVKQLLKSNPSYIDSSRGYYEIPLLISSVYSGNIQLVKYVLENSDQINQPTHHGEIAIHFAVDLKHPDIAELLIKNGADINRTSTDYRKLTPIYLAARSGDLSMVQLLLEKGATLDIDFHPAYTPIQGAAISGNPDIFFYLLERSDTTTFDWGKVLENSIYSYNMDVIHYLVDEQKIDLKSTKITYSDLLPLELILKNKGITEDADIEENFRLIEYMVSQGCRFKDVNNGNIMGWAMEHSNDQTIAYLLEQGYEFPEPDTYGRSYLVLALDELSFISARHLLQKGAPTEFRDKPLILYFADGYYPTAPILEFLIKEGVNKPYYEEAFLQCAKHNDLPAVQVFRYNGVDINAKDEEGRNALYYAQDTELLEYLIINGVNGYDSITQQHLLNNLNALKVLDKFWIPVPMPQDSINKGLRIAAQSGDEEMVTYFLNRGAEVNNKGDVLLPKRYRWYEEPLGKTALMENSWQGYPECTYDKKDTLSSVIVKLLLAAGAYPNIKDKNGETALHYALGKGWCKFDISPIPMGNRAERDGGSHGDPAPYPWQNNSLIIQALIEGGADVNIPDVNGFTPLMLAVKNWRNSSIPFLLEYGCNIEYKAKTGQTALMMAIDYDNLEAFELLIEAGANTAIKDRRGKTIFDKITNYETYSFLKRKGYQDQIPKRTINQVFAHTFYTYWYEMPDTLILDTLLVDGANINYPMDSNKETAFMYVLDKYKFSEEHLDFLLRRGANINAQDQYQRTALLKVASGYQPSVEVIQYLRKNGANPHIPDNHGKTGYMYAEQRGYTDVLPYLK